MTPQHLLASTAASALCLFTLPALAQSPQQAEEGDWVTVEGIVNTVEDDSFTLDYGADVIEVEFDALFSSIEADEQLRSGDTVTVFGQADNDWFEGRVIDAEQVFVEDRSTYYSVNYVPGYVVASTRTDANSSLDGTYVSLEGTVQKVSDRKFVLDHGESEVRVDTAEMTYNPLDEDGIQQIKAGDRVTVSGELDDSLFADMSLEADRIYTLRNSDTQAATSTRTSQADKQQQRMAQNDQRSNKANGKSKGDADSTSKADRRTANAEERQTQNRNDREQNISDNAEFAMIDANSNGVISESEWVDYVAEPKNISEKAARKMFDSVARDDDRLTRNEFVSPSDQVDRMFDNIRNNNS